MPINQRFREKASGKASAKTIPVLSDCREDIIFWVVNFFETGNWEWSSWQQYLWNALGGAVGGVISIWNPSLGVAIGSGLGTLISGILEMYVGNNSNNITWGNLLKDTALSAITGFAFGKFTQTLPIKGITKGSHSIFQVSKSLITKTLKKSISKITMKSFGKILTYQVISGFSLGWLLETLFNN